jgi:SAM-dependent methyltransferase
VAGRSVLEIGAGAGRVSKVLADAGASRLVLVDRSSAALELARGLLGSDPRVEYVEADAFELPFGERFDVVFSAGLVEHFSGAEQSRLMRVHAEHSRRDVAVVAPASPHWNDLRMRFAAVRERFGYQRPLTRRRLRELMVGAGIRPRVARRFFPAYGLGWVVGPEVIFGMLRMFDCIEDAVGGLILGVGSVT